MKAPKLHPYQVKAKNKLLQILEKNQIAYLAGQVRTGKTLTVLHTVYEYLTPGLLSTDLSEILFITSKKAIPDIQDQIKKSKVNLNITLINYESLHKYIKKKFDFIIIDEGHRLGAFPKPGKICKLIQKYFKAYAFLIMSGTPSPESYSQLFHQFWAIGKGPWMKYKNFYRWADKYVNKETVYIGMGHNPIDYSDCKPKVLDDFKKYRVTMTQKDAGFDGEVIEKIHTIKIPDKIALQLAVLERNLVMDKPDLTADTAAKLKSYFHQMASGTVIDIDEKAHLLSDYKIKYIKEKFKDKHIAIYYVYRKEGELLKKHFKNWTDSPEEFKKTNKIFICQIQSGREGVNLLGADGIIFYNISYSATSYWQARARSQSRTSGDVTIHWIFSSSGVEHAIYEIVQGKKDFTTKHFSDYVRDIHSSKNKKVVKETWMESSEASRYRSSRTSRPYGTAKRKSNIHRSKTTRKKAHATTGKKYKVTS